MNKRINYAVAASIMKQYREFSIYTTYVYTIILIKEVFPRDVKPNGLWTSIALYIDELVYYLLGVLREKKTTFNLD